MASVTWEQFHQELAECRRCPLHMGATHRVPGQGDLYSPLMLIGEGPGEVEDREGLAFVGPAGQLLTRMLQSIGLPRDRVYICNAVKCRPPQNRTPEFAEMGACKYLLRYQTALIRPQVILLLGASAAKITLGPDIRITRDRGQWFRREGLIRPAGAAPGDALVHGDIWMMPTYHPSALLRDPAKKREAWQDLQMLREKLIELGLYPDIYGQDDISATNL